MTRKLGFLFNREGVKQCNVLPLKNDMYQIVKISDNPAIRTCGMNESEFQSFKKKNKLYFLDELKQPDLFDFLETSEAL
ncbi:hypothetical protein [Macrococcus capreoli]|uniref:hypothetical protein n=1 Tax=Macrococcus capreoli TaxID=2982690 RepID=UPI0021D60ED1|nr:hypothetical protein [Macrococcus sp. TMW 2.2395]MCU7557279.1 hypothetical protein [Macrococcus sp. TMW 2.2395]